MASKHLIDIVYDIAKTERKDKHFTFDEVWKKLIKEAKLSKEEQVTLKGAVYTDLLQDARFIYAGNKKWHLREYISQDQMENFQHALYDFDTTFNPNEKLHGDTEDILENEELEEMLRSELDVEDEEVYDEIESKIEKSGKGEEE